MKILRHISVLLMLCALPALAAQQNHERVRETALAFARAQTQALPGKVEIRVGKLDPRIVLRACSALEAFLPSGSPMMGRTNIGVRCKEQPGWSIYVQTNIRVTTLLLTANRPLAQNTVLSESDLSLQSGELGQPGILTDPAQAVGKTLKFGIGAGQVLRENMLRAPRVVSQNQTVEVRVQSRDFIVRSSGLALNNGEEGQNIRVRMASGQVINGTATKDGTVEVRP